MYLPTWLYSSDGKAEIIRDQETFDKRVADGWKDSPARFSEEAIAADKAAADKAAADKAAAKKSSKGAVKNPAEKHVDDLI